MRMILHARFPHDPFNTYVKDGSISEKMGRILDELKPEAAYFTEFDGHRGALLVLHVDASGRWFARGLRLELVFLGGLYRPTLDAVEGSWPLDMIGHFNADKAFLGADCIDSRAGLTTPSIAVAAIELAMIRRTRGEVVVLADSSKFGLVGAVVICPLDQIDVVLVDDGVDAEVCERIHRAGPRCEVI